jgi:diguanylate cyclase (GGDEF)-like protein
VVRVPALRQAVDGLAPFAPWLVFGAGVLLGWRFRHAQLVLALLVLFAADQALLLLAPAGVAGAGPGRITFTALALLVPLDLAALAWLAARPVAGWMIAALAAQPLAVALLLSPELEGAAGLLEGTLFGARAALGTALSEPALIVFVLALGAAVARFLMRRTIIQSSLAWAIAATLGAFAQGGGGSAAGLYFSAGGLVLVISLVETSHRMAYVDELTGLPGRRALDEALSRLAGQYAVAMVDIDHFKRFNDEHGHDVGDQLLRKIGAALERVPGGGRAYRYGGEEFAVVFASQTLEQALPQLERIRAEVEAYRMAVRGGDRPKDAEAGSKRRAPVGAPTRPSRVLSVTVSIGVAQSPGFGASPAQVLRFADEALYRAKEAGRNRVSR